MVLDNEIRICFQSAAVGDAEESFSGQVDDGLNGLSATARDVMEAGVFQVLGAIPPGWPQRARRRRLAEGISRAALGRAGKTNCAATGRSPGVSPGRFKTDAWFGPSNPLAGRPCHYES